MKKLMIVCGSGIATSTIAEGKIKEYLEKEGVLSQVQTYKGNIAEYINQIGRL